MKENTAQKKNTFEVDLYDSSDSQVLKTLNFFITKVLQIRESFP